MRTVVIAGAGSIGERHARCFLATGRCRVAIAEPAGPVRERVGARYPLAGTFPSLEAAVEGTAPDAVVVATPAHLHLAQARFALERGLPVLIEKPLSVSREGVAEVLRAAAGRVAGVAYVLRCHPLLARMREVIASGELGRPLQVVGVSGQHFPTYRPAYREIYYRDRATGGGAIQDALTHLVNAGEWLAGPVDRLVADAAHQALPGVEVEDTVHLLTRQGGALGSYALNQHQAPNEATLTVVCERATVRWEGHRSRWLRQSTPDTPWVVEEDPSLDRDSLFIRQAHAFLDALEHGSPLSCTLEEGLQTLRVNLAALESLETGAWVRLRPA